MPVRSVTLGFCGRYFSTWLEATLPFTHESFAINSKDRHWLTLEEALDVTRDFITDREDGRWVRRWIDRQLHIMREHHSKVASLPRDLPPFLSLNSPVFAIASSVRNLQILTNPRLQTLGFEKVIDAFRAFQDISTFLGNDLTESNATPLTVGGDEVIAKAKGFDEMSFRTAAPGHKKLNRKAHKVKKRQVPDP
jgi:hypothetical protein